MYKDIKTQVYKANQELVEHGLVVFTFGNTSAVDRKNNIVAIKPSGVSYEKMSIEDIVIVDMQGKIIEGQLNPSSDTQTHLKLYNSFPSIGGIVHTHSRWATIWAQAGKSIPCLGTTHADHFYGRIPCTRELKTEEINTEYEMNTGKLIVETYKNIHPLEMPGVLVNNHGPFTFGKNVDSAVYNAVILEEVALMAYHTEKITSRKDINSALLDKHFKRKHGSDAYYGQKNS